MSVSPRRPDDATVMMLSAEPHRRFNALTGEWVLVSTGRTQRPWLGAEETPASENRPAYDPTCSLCPGNRRTGGSLNPSYDNTFVFTNDFAALIPDAVGSAIHQPLFRAEPSPGTCRVVCFSPRHDLAMADLGTSEIRAVVDVWAQQTTELGRKYPWVQVFENHGEAMGASNPHPHGQIWASLARPVEAQREDREQRQYADSVGRVLLEDYAAAEADGPRVVGSNPSWLAVVPFWAAWPFEVLLMPREPVARLPDLDDERRTALATALRELTARYDALFSQPFPYSMGWHQAPFGEGDPTAWQLHAHFYPPLLRASVRKFMVGYELLAEPQRDFAPEDAALLLRKALPGGV